MPNHEQQIKAAIYLVKVNPERYEFIENGPYIDFKDKKENRSLFKYYRPGIPKQESVLTDKELKKISAPFDEGTYLDDINQITTTKDKERMRDWYEKDLTKIEEK